MTVVLVLLVGVFLAYVNGANDVSKGIATLVGSGVTDYRRAISWGAAWTAAGGFLGALFAGAMLTTFGNGLLAPGTTPTFAAAVALVLGAAGWVLFATLTGLPVSTTHAIVGSLTGVAALAYGTGAVRWGALGGKVFLPLLVSPFAALLLTGLLLRVTRSRAGGTEARTDCLCAEVEPAVVAAAGASFHRSSALVPAELKLRVTTGPAEVCASSQPATVRLTLDHLHWLTSGAASLARGMNDSPKMVALLVAASALAGKATIPAPNLFAVVTVAMVAGSLVAGRRVTHVLAEKMTAMDHHEGFSANLVTAGLVTAGAIYGLPMSTTHVSSGGIISAGFARGSLNHKTLRDIVLAWIVTLPAAAGLGMVAYLVARAISG
ncbi:MAG: inorganic phosphate transporter [Candidatus Rokubacteria bacterium]|nr:inorganic phosphate transporter [Candidatus Rokubacteria bacterium]